MSARRHCIVHILVLSAGILTAAPSAATGLYVRVRDSLGTGLATAGGSARAEDASTVFFNPAGMALLPESMIQAGIELIGFESRIANRGATATTLGTGSVPMPYPGHDDEGGGPTPVPHFYYVRPITKMLAVGVAVTAPFGLAVNYSSQWFGRYDSYRNRLTTLELAPAISWSLTKEWSIGAGLNVQFADASLVNAIPNVFNPSGPTPETDGRAKLKGQGWALGYNVGVHYHPSAATRIGAHYRSSMRHELDGDAGVSGLTGALATANGTTGTETVFRLPWIFTAGIAHQISSHWTLLAEVQRFGWSKFDTIKVKFDNGTEVLRPQRFHNNTSVSVGVVFKPDTNGPWTFRAGARLDQTPTGALRNTSVPDTDALWLGAGASYVLSNRLKLDIAYLQGLYEKAPIDLNVPVFAGTAAAGNVNVRGTLDPRVRVLSFSVRYTL